MIQLLQIKKNQEIKNQRQQNVKYSLDNLNLALQRKQKQRQMLALQRSQQIGQINNLPSQLNKQIQLKNRSQSAKRLQFISEISKQLEQKQRVKNMNQEEKKRQKYSLNQVQQQHDKERQLYLNKLKNDYIEGSKNQKVYQMINQDKQRRSIQRENFIQNIIKNTAPRYISSARQSQSMSNPLSKSQIRQQITKFNKQQYENKRLMSKKSVVDQILQDKHKMQLVSKQLEQEKIRKHLLKLNQRQKFTQELGNQLKLHQKSKSSKNLLNPQEMKMNLPILYNDENISSKPNVMMLGIVHDSEAEKQKKNIERLLNIKNAQNNFVYSTRQVISSMNNY